ncbi:plastocyanin/azurin family copper-binding protein [Jiella sp. M17.18]|uniref:plastocyanin/azurin family copper-binding protein n=1 Tax=Jiella sp. M17.18 TaxID=3234247 RepID=UPI0034DF7E0E
MTAPRPLLPILAVTLPSAVFGFCLTAVLAWGKAEPVAVVNQSGREFDRKAITVTSGEAVRFTNEDPFLHQIYVDSPAFSFDSTEQMPGNSVDVTFTTPGVFQVRCGIHPRMRLDVTVVKPSVQH